MSRVATELVSTYIKPADKIKLIKEAKSYRLTMSSFIRMLIDDHFEAKKKCKK